MSHGDVFELSVELDALQGTESRLASLNNKALKQQTQKSEIEFAASELEENIDTCHRENKKLTKLYAEHDKLTKLVEMLRGQRQSFMSTVWNSILAASSTFVDNATDGWITGLGRDDAGNFTFSERGGVYAPVIGCASGAQKAFLGVGVRVGLGQALLGRNMALLLDEPTEAMSEDNAGNLAAALLALGGQTLFITHRNKEAVSAQRVIQI